MKTSHSWVIINKHKPVCSLCKKVDKELTNEDCPVQVKLNNKGNGRRIKK